MGEIPLRGTEVYIPNHILPSDHKEKGVLETEFFFIFFKVLRENLLSRIALDGE